MDCVAAELTLNSCVKNRVENLGLSAVRCIRAYLPHHTTLLTLGLYCIHFAH